MQLLLLSFFFFQAEDGIRDYKVTGVQTCALPISAIAVVLALGGRLVSIPVLVALVATAVCVALITAAQTVPRAGREPSTVQLVMREIGRASCRERVQRAGVARA